MIPSPRMHVGSRSRRPERRPLLKDRAYDELKQLIKEEALAPGSVVSERELAARLGMSQQPVRAAVQRLEMDGFVHISPQRGILILEDSHQEVADIFDIRQALETHVVRAIAGRLDREQTRALQANLDAQRRAAEEQDLIRATELDADFHLMLCTFAGNNEICRVMSGLRGRLHRAILQVHVDTPNRPMTSYQEHAEVARLIVEGRPDAAVAAIIKHLAFGRDQLLGLRQPEGTQVPSPTP